jgi:LuxR family maltose regulon positive regulatory protein
VIRQQLNEKLTQGLQLGHKLTLFSAPAGFGKTTLVRKWIDKLGTEIPNRSVITYRIAWMSLDEGDNDVSRFLSYLVAALQTIAPNIGDGMLAVLQSPRHPPSESILTTLLNEITTVSDNFVLVLDDYHLINAQAVDNALTFLLEHLPPQMHLVIATREDPDLPVWPIYSTNGTI